MLSEKTVMIIGGTGKVGSYASYFLARSPQLKRLVIVGRDEKKGVTVLNNSLVNSAISHGPEKIEFISADVFTQENFWKTIQEIQPAVIANAVAPLSFYSWFEKQRRQKREISLPVTPLIYLPSVLKLMEHVKKSKADSQVVNLASPDITNLLATRVGLGPLIGAGTIDLTVQGIRWIVSRRRNVPLEAVSVRMVIHRVHRGRMYLATPLEKFPHYLRIHVGTVDVTDDYDTDRIISEAVDVTGTESLTCPNTTNDSMTAASMVRNVLAVLNDSQEVLHVPGVGEMPGGVPARIGAKGAEIMLPDNLSYEEALRINQEGMKLEGLEHIEKDGTVTFTDAMLTRLKKFGIEYSKTMNIPEIVNAAEKNIRIIKQLINN